MICKCSEPHLKVYTPPCQQEQTKIIKFHEVGLYIYVALFCIAVQCCRVYIAPVIDKFLQFLPLNNRQNDTQNFSVMWLWIISQLFFFFNLFLLRSNSANHIIQMWHHGQYNIHGYSHMPSTPQKPFVHKVKRGDKYSQYNHHNTDKTYVYLT